MSAISEQLPVWLLVLITFSGTLAMHMFVPALPTAAQELGASVAAMQMTISLYIVGLAIGQLVYGPLSDCFGRRPVLIAGLALYTAAGVAAILASATNGLLVARLLQALGGCAGLVLGRAMVRDTAAAHEAARKLALLNLVVVIGPALGPLIGAVLSTSLGWRSIFIAFIALGVLNVVLSWRVLKETGKPTGNLSIRFIGYSYRDLLSSPIFLGYVIGGSCATTSVYGFVAAAPFIVTRELSGSLHDVGLYLGLLAVSMSVGSAVASRAVGRMSLERLAIGANALSVAAACIFLGCVLLGKITIVLLVSLMCLFTFGAGMSSPAALTKAISVDPKYIGTASGLYGFGQMAVGALCTSLTGIGNDAMFATASVLVAAGVLGQVAFWVALHHEAQGRGS